MPRIIKNTFLSYIPESIITEQKVNQARIFSLNNSSIKKGDIVYLCEREIRPKDNFALQFALQKSNELGLDLKIIHPKIFYTYKPKRLFLDKQIKQTQNIFNELGLDFEIIAKNPYEILKSLKIALLIIDFNPILDRSYLKEVDYKIYEVDGHNVVPARFVSNKQEYAASTIRRKIYYNIYPFLTEFYGRTSKKVEADFVLDDFIKNRLPYYFEYKNNPSNNVLSGLSKYLNLGFISAQRVALEVLKSDVSRVDKETFLEELIIRKELSDNFCLYSNYKDYSGVPSWAKISIQTHRNDLRTYIYSLNELEFGKTHDKLWNAAQNQLIKEGVIHGYVRMYWAKKLFEWVQNPDQALEFAIYLNDKYAYDSPSSNGYTSILWALGGLHDRAFVSYPVTGKIRRMTYDSLRKKYDISGYLKKYS